MLTAVVAHPPRFGARVASFDASDAQKIQGVKYIVEVPNGVAVLAVSFWQAKKARDALKIVWDESQAFKRSSTYIMKMTPYHRATSPEATPGRPNAPSKGRLFMIGRKIGTVSSKMPTQSRNMPRMNSTVIIRNRIP